MSESHTSRNGALIARLISVSMEIDDDDRDVINVQVEVSNEASIPMGQLEPLIETSEGTSFTPTDAITSIGPGLSRTYEFNFSIMGGDWNFRLWHNSAGGRRSVDIGPHHSEFTLKKADPTRTPTSSMGAGLFGGAFDLGMDTFGSTSERELIDSRHIELVEYEAEHDEGGSTRINVLDDEPAPPLSAPLEPISPIEPLTPLSAPTAPPEPPVATPAPSLEMPTGPPQAPPAGPPQAPPAALPEPPVATPTPSLEMPAGPPQAPPAGPPQAPPAAPPVESQAPPAGPPSNDPMAIIMAQTNSQTPPTGPPQEAPINSPTGPPTAPPSGPPSAPPTGPPSGPPQN
ncbi:MAG TPA: hypothetical protein EYQ85_03045 [Candidatus Poseidoniales archaeon]|nr:hypothetical protein [Candidatus Poseidoniales archaeon]